MYDGAMEADSSIADEETADGHWLLLKYANSVPIRLDARLLDRIAAADETLYLVVEPLAVALAITSGARAAARIAETLAPYTRSAPITHREACEDARRRRDLAARNLSDNGAFALYVGKHDVYFNGDDFCVADASAFSLDDAIRSSQVRESLFLWHLEPPVLLPATLPLLVAAASRRPPESVAELSQRIAEYEKHFGGV